MTLYLDHNATTPLDERVMAAMLPYLRGGFGNPSSLHAAGRYARTAVDAAREQVAALVGARPNQVVFTSGGTEACNWALKGAAFGRPPGRLAVSAIEHAAVRQPAAALGRSGWAVSCIGVDGDGRANPEYLEQALRADTRLVAVMWANNETGVVQPVAQLAGRCREHGALFFTDAVQMAGKLPIDFAASGAHLMSLSAHKLYGPKGVGALVVDAELEPLIHGGGQERGRRGGTENVAAIVGFGQAAELAAAELEIRRRRHNNLVRYLEMRLAAEVPDAVVFGAGAERLPNTLFFALPGLDGQTLVLELDRGGIALSAGSACGSAHSEPSPVLKAMGIAPELARGALRVSFGDGNGESDVEALVQALKVRAGRLKAMAGAAW